MPFRKRIIENRAAGAPWRPAAKGGRFPMPGRFTITGEMKYVVRKVVMKISSPGKSPENGGSGTRVVHTQAAGGVRRRLGLPSDRTIR